MVKMIYNTHTIRIACGIKYWNFLDKTTKEDRQNRHHPKRKIAEWMNAVMGGIECENIFATFSLSLWNYGYKTGAFVHSFSTYYKSAWLPNSKLQKSSIFTINDFMSLFECDAHAFQCYSSLKREFLGSLLTLLRVKEIIKHFSGVWKSRLSMQMKQWEVKPIWTSSFQFLLLLHFSHRLIFLCARLPFFWIIHSFFSSLEAKVSNFSP